MRCRDAFTNIQFRLMAIVLACRRRIRGERRYIALIVLLFAQATSAQIGLVPGIPHQTTLAPSFLSHADYNIDGFEDVIATSGSGNSITVLFGLDGTNFGHVLDLAVGQQAGRNASRDINGDGSPDIVAIDTVLP